MANIIEFEDKVDLIDSPEVPDNQKLKAREINEIRDLINEAYYRVKNLEINGTVGGDTVPIGTIMSYAGDGIQNGWLNCDGSEISRTDYIDLFAVIGTKYGVGDGSTTFNLPKGLEPIYYGSEDELELNLTRYTPAMRVIIKAEQIVPITSEVIKDFKDASDFNAPSAKLVMNSFSNPNMLVNGDFQVWQRGSSFNGKTGSMCTADRWVFDIVSDSNYSEVIISRPIDNVGIQIKTKKDKRFWIKNSIEINSCFKEEFKQRGITVSFDVKGQSAFKSKLVVGNNTNGELGKNYFEFLYDITTETKRIEFFIDSALDIKESIAFDILPYRIDDSIKSQVPNDEIVIINKVKVELGKISTPFVPRLYAEELALCKRYCQQLYISKTKYGETAKSAIIEYVQFQTTMRSTPTISTQVFDSYNLDYFNVEPYDMDYYKISYMLTQQIGYRISIKIFADAEIYYT